MSGTNAELIEQARGIGNWRHHETGPEGEGRTGPTLFARLVYALEAANLTSAEDQMYVKRMEAERDAVLAVLEKAQGLYGNTSGTGEQLAFAMWEILDAGLIEADK